MIAAAVAVFGLGVVVGVALDIFGVFGDDPPPVVTYGAQGEVERLDTLVEGACLTGEVSDDLRRFQIGRQVSCERPHAFEAFGDVTAPEPDGGSYDADALAWFGFDACYFLFEPYVGASYDTSSLVVTAAVPARAEWTRGARAIRCLLFDFEGGTLDQALKDSGI